jgi:hypothetical protein
MALIKKTNKRLEHPTEPGAWFVVRLPLSAGDLAAMRSDGSSIAMSLDLAAEVIKEWSYDAPVSLDTVKDLDVDTFTWLSREIQEASGIRSEDEKKDFGSSSSPTLALVEGDSPKSSGI